VLEPDDDGPVDVLVAHELLGNFLDYDELTTAIVGVSVGVERAGPEVKERFGGLMAGDSPNGS
jgi:hypothetical protein